MEIKQEFQCGCLLEKTEDLDTVCYMVEQSIIQTAKANGVCLKAVTIGTGRVLGSLLASVAEQYPQFDKAEYKAMILAQMDVGVTHAEKHIATEAGQRVDN